MTPFKSADAEIAHPAAESLETDLLSNHVRAVMQDYFARLDGHSANNLYELVMREVEQPLILTVLEHCGHNQTRAAKVLGVSRSTLRKKLSQFGIDQASNP
jgi:Fis family transcriptional regulator